MVWYVLVRWPSQVAREGKWRGATTKGRRLVQAVKFVRLCRVGYNSPWFPPHSRGKERPRKPTLRARENDSTPTTGPACPRAGREEGEKTRHGSTSKNA